MGVGVVSKQVLAAEEQCVGAETGVRQTARGQSGGGGAAMRCDAIRDDLRVKRRKEYKANNGQRLMLTNSAQSAFQLSSFPGRVHLARRP